jgi:hypothetical protein
VLNNSICLSCLSNCLSCLSANASYCTSCLSNDYLFNGTCLTACPDFYFADASGNCLRCLSPCGKCTSLTVCVSCSDPLNFMEGGTCVSACTYPKAGINGTCYSCASQCLTCMATVSTCLLCAAGFYYFPATSACQMSCSSYVVNASFSSSGNNECTVACPAGTYPNNATLYCSACPSVCSQCSSATSCSQCSTGYSLYLSFCYDPCPLAAPYSINALCLTCDITNCRTCTSTTYCSACSANYLLIAHGSSSACIASCSNGQIYNSATLACEAGSGTATGSSNIVESTVPPYTFLITATALAFALFLVKFKYPSTELPLVMFLMLNLANSAILANLLYIEIVNSALIPSVSVSTAILFTAAAIQLASSLGSLVAVARIRDPELVKVWTEHPLSFIAILVFCLVDSNFMFVLTSQMLGLEIFKAKLNGGSMMQVLKVGLASSLLVKILTMVYSAMQLTYYRGHAYRLLAEAVAYPIENSAIIECLILSVATLLLLVYLICKLGSDEKDEDGTKQEDSHQSLMDEANAFDKRNESNAQIMMSVDNSDMVVDINSLKDEKEVSDVEGTGLFYQDGSDTPSKRIFKTNKVTPDEMLRRMDGRIDEDEEGEEEVLDMTNNLFFMD